MRVQKFNEHTIISSMVEDFINSLESIKESNTSISKWKEYEKKLIKDLKLNLSIVGTFGAGVGVVFPIVDGLIRNMKLNIQLTPHNIVLLTITTISIIYLEEKKSKISASTQDSITKDCKSMLEELRMAGIGDGIVKKLIKGFESIKNIFNVIGKHIGAVVGGFIDIFAYASLAMPIMNGISAIINKYDLNLDSIVHNFIGLAMGVGSLIAKHGIVDILNRLKGKFAISAKKVIDEIETPVIQKFGDVEPDISTDIIGSDMIKED